jgi:hypothetical protein
MPEISRFYGIKIFMNYMDHAPPHFYAWYGEYKVSISIRDSVVKGEMPNRALKIIFSWMELHLEELDECWEKAQKGVMLNYIEPLK